jgi:hypothetical protein
MSLGTTSFLALVVGEKSRAPSFVAAFQDLISDRAPNEGQCFKSDAAGSE